MGNRSIILRCLGVLAILLVVGCSNDDESSNDAEPSNAANAVCIPGVQQECACEGFYQECKEDGSGFTSCECGESSEGMSNENLAGLPTNQQIQPSGREADEAAGQTTEGMVTPDVNDGQMEASAGRPMVDDDPTSQGGVPAAGEPAAGEPGGEACDEENNDPCSSLEFGRGDTVTSSQVFPQTPAEFTFETWLRWDGLTGEEWYPIASRGHGTTQAQFWLAIRGDVNHWCGNQPGGLHFQVQGGNYCTFSDPLMPNTWYHVAAQQTATGLELYLNGTKVNAPNNIIGTPQPGTPPLRVGDYGPGTFFNGLIESAHLAHEVLYDGQFAPATLTPTQTSQILWQFDEGDGASASDSSGNDNQATITGAAWSEACPR